MIAAATTTTITAATDTCERLAATPPRIAAVSPGSTNPTNSASSAKTTSATTDRTAPRGAPSGGARKFVMCCGPSESEAYGPPVSFLGRGGDHGGEGGVQPFELGDRDAQARDDGGRDPLGLRAQRPAGRGEGDRQVAL